MRVDPATVTGLDVADALGGGEWRAICFAPGYFVSEFGEVARATALRGIRRVRPWPNPRGYHRAMLWPGGTKQKAVGIHRLVALAFIGSPPDGAGTFVCHRDDDRANNHPSNLYWGDAKSNANDMLRNGHNPRGLTNYRARRAIELARAGATTLEIAKTFGVAEATVRSLMRGQTWTHIEGERVLNLHVSKNARLVEMVRAGATTRAAATAIGLGIQTAHEMISRARRLGQLPRPVRALSQAKAPKAREPNRCGLCHMTGHYAKTCTTRKAA